MINHQSSLLFRSKTVMLNVSIVAFSLPFYFWFLKFYIYNDFLNFFKCLNVSIFFKNILESLKHIQINLVGNRNISNQH